MRNASVAVVAVLMAATLLADERRFARAALRWQRERSPASLFHLATSGLFLAEDVTALVA
jgi:hypothetical protein